jgi:hypothetical protein
MAQPVELYDFAQLSLRAAHAVGDHPSDPALELKLNGEFPADGAEFQRIFQACREAIVTGWMCQRSAAVIRFGRVIKPAGLLGRFSVDVVEMSDVVGPLHIRWSRGRLDGLPTGLANHWCSSTMTSKLAMGSFSIASRELERPSQKRSEPWRTRYGRHARSNRVARRLSRCDLRRFGTSRCEYAIMAGRLRISPRPQQRSGGRRKQRPAPENLQCEKRVWERGRSAHSCCGRA